MDATWALSVTMKGRWTKLKAGEPVDFLSECEHDPSAVSFGRYADECGDPSFSYKNDSKSEVVGALYYNKMDGRILSFDNNTNLVLKLCRLRAQHLTFAYGIAAYDVDYDDYSDVCGSVSVHYDFNNVFTLALVWDYMRSSATCTVSMMYDYPVAPPPAMVPSSSAQGYFNEMPPPLNDPPSYSSASKDDATGGGPRVATVVIVVMILLAIIVMAATMIVLASGSRSNDKITSNDEQPDMTEQNMRTGGGMTVIVPEFRVPSTPPPLTTKSTTQASTKKEATEETTEEDTRSTTTELPTTRAKKDTWAGLICTIGTKLSAPKILPEDTWCDYLFYDSVYKEGPAPFDPGNLPPALSILLGHLSRYGYTQLGIGFAYKYTQHLNSELSKNDSDTPVVLEHFFDKNICNFGILDTATDGLEKSTLEEMLESLKLIDGFVRSKGAWPKTCHTVVAVPTPDTGLEDVYLEIFPSYKFDLNSAAESIEKLIARGMDAVWALSVTIKGRWTKLKVGEPVDFLSECEHDPSAESFGRYVVACEDPSFSYKNDSKSEVVGALYYNKMDRRILSFDNNTSLVLKLCRLRAQHLTFAFGIAAYDVDYDDYSGVCHSRFVYGYFTVLVLSILQDYVRYAFTDPKDYNDCAALAY
ncbi:hypothetical protein MTO96_017709 [Rhipicephalus appendiculatus]